MEIEKLPILEGNKITYPMLEGDNSNTFKNTEAARSFVTWHPMMTEYIYVDSEGDKFLITKKRL